MYPRYFMMQDPDVTEDEHMLLQCLSHFNIMDWQLNDHRPEGSQKGIFLEDQVLQAVRIMRVERKFPTWVVFACQILVDTRRELGTQVDQGCKNLKRQGAWLMEAWNKCLETGKGNKINDFHKKNDPVIRKELEWLKTTSQGDFVQEMIDDYFKKEQHKISRYSWGDFFLLKNHPTI